MRIFNYKPKAELRNIKNTKDKIHWRHWRLRQTPTLNKHTLVTTYNDLTLREGNTQTKYTETGRDTGDTIRDRWN